jgi:YD repeat-containing protein
LFLVTLLLFSACSDSGGGKNSPPPIGGDEVPVQVSLSCRTLTTDSGEEQAGTAVKQEIFGSLPNSAALPTPGMITECGTPSWETSVAPPKVTTYGYDASGRILSVHREWGEGPQQPGISSSDTTQTYSLTASEPGEQPCAKVLERTQTDSNGHTTKTRACTESSFHLSRSDAEGRTITYAYDEAGLTTRVTNPNGSYVTQEYYHACPIAQDGSTPTCPSTSTALGECPYGDQTIARNCLVETQLAGTDPDTGAANFSERDGYATVIVKDGLARPVEVYDNLGAGTNGYTEIQRRQVREYNDLAQATAATAEVGVASPIVYRATTSFDAKFRPIQTCDARGVSQEWVHDDIGQHRKMTINGHQQFRVSVNDGQKVTALQDCPIVGEATMPGTDCPTVAANSSSASCSGNVYLTDIDRDGAGTQRSMTASDPNAAAVGASIESLTGTPFYSAELMKYGFDFASTPTGNGQAVHANATWRRDLLGKALGNSIEVEAATTESFSSSSFMFDGVGNQQAEQNALGAMLQETFVYTPTRNLSQQTRPSGRTFYSYYDGMDRLIRHCYASDPGGSEGEILMHDALDGRVLRVTHFTNPGACSECADDGCGDVLEDSITFVYTPFGSIESKTYREKQPDGTFLETRMEWAYDEYHRPTCLADAAATMAGSTCPSSPTPAGWTPNANELLTYYTYWPDDDPYRRGFLKSACRGIQRKMGESITFDTECLDTDYYTSVDTDGVCGVDEATGALANLLKTQSLCSGGSCLDGAGTPIYETTYEYDGHRRGCSVESRTASGALIQASTYTHDQYDNVITESHSSELDASVGTNYRVAYQYDGMMRVIALQRTDLQGNQIESVSYEYDAASNITKEVQTITQ